jgi:ribosomal protein L29
MVAKKVRAYELRKKSKEDLEKQLVELKKELYNLRVSKVVGSNTTNLLNM